MKSIQIFCQYCEDIRKEADGKISLMGVLPGELHISARENATIGKICAFVNVVVHPKNLSSALTIQILWNDDILRESIVPDDLIKQLEASAPKEANQQIARAVINYMAQISNIKVGSGGRLRARVKAGDQYIEAVSLRVTSNT